LCWLAGCFRTAGNRSVGHVKPNVRGNRATTVGRQGPGCDDAPCVTARALVACRWRSG
jgi:hypothetical protein